MQLIDQYRQDVQQLLNMADKNNLAVVMKAVELSSHYAAMALDQAGSASADTNLDMTAAQKLLAAKGNSVQSATATYTTIMPAAETSDEDAKKVPASDNDLFKVERKLIGAIVGNRFFTEAAVRQLDLADGDTVRIRDSYDHDGPEVTIVERNRSTQEPRIKTVNGAVISRDDTLPADYQYVASKNITGDTLLETKDGLPFTFLIKPTDVARLGLRSGDIVDLSWYNTDGPEVATVTWVYKDKKGIKPLKQHVAKPKKKAAAVVAVSSATDSAAPKTTLAKQYTPQLKFDLDGKNVLFIGNVKSKPQLELVVAAHFGGSVAATDSQKGTQLKHKLGRADVAVLITDEVHHITTNTSVKIAKKLGVPYAVANSDAPLLIEQALYRAIAGMPAYEPSQGSFDYPEV
ncbi:DUF2325 domain-containing protein [Lacticaseibacillus zhaodongensis]|uniref:DUF2325 domain-containing protein n=1 Tax=Lacticaseibacillus zhaodongensis TaxID=2668065 RepID=UPI0012D36075|nr:DUF2325 domain-containing protein [Lacticaseibacillus zhaodongensis]